MWAVRDSGGITFFRPQQIAAYATDGFLPHLPKCQPHPQNSSIHRHHRYNSKNNKMAPPPHRRTNTKPTQTHLPKSVLPHHKTVPKLTKSTDAGILRNARPDGTRSGAGRAIDKPVHKNGFVVVWAQKIDAGVGRLALAVPAARRSCGRRWGRGGCGRWRRPTRSKMGAGGGDAQRPAPDPWLGLGRQRASARQLPEPHLGWLVGAHGRHRDVYFRAPAFSFSSSAFSFCFRLSSRCCSGCRRGQWS